MRIRAGTKRDRQKAFTLIEVVVGIALVAIAVLGLAEMFTLSVVNNLKSDRVTSASFLAQQQIDRLRSLTAGELSLVAGSAAVDINNDGINDFFQDELIDINQDNLNDFRRITDVQAYGTAWQVRIFIFTAEQFEADMNVLTANPAEHRVKARIDTIIHR
jgi:prepilin-type N-terminal cleavage/methylation domain-containing protein